jgi:hypothetical protein
MYMNNIRGGNVQQQYSKIVLLGLLFIWVTSLFAQAPDTLWTKTFGAANTEEGRAVQPTTDNGYIIAGYTMSYGPGDADLFLVKTNNSGTALWTQVYGGTGNDAAYAIQQTRDGGYIVAGYTNSFGAGNYDIYFLKTNAVGETTWTKTYGGDSLERSYSVKQTFDNGYVIAGYTRSFGAGLSDIWLLKTDSLGDTTWTKTYGGAGNDQCYAVDQTADSGYVLTGWSTSFGSYDMYVIKTYANGDTMWTRTYGGQYDDEGYSVQQTLDNGYIIAGYRSVLSPTHPDLYVVKTDANGDTLWTRTFGNASYDDVAWSVEQLADSGYIIAGYTYSYGAGTPTYPNMWLIKLDVSGDTVFTQTYGGSGSDKAYSVKQTSDNGYIITGSTDSFGPANLNVYLVKTTGDTIPPAPPVLISPSDDSYCGDSSITFVWHPAVDTGWGIQEYELHYALDSLFSGTTTVITQDTIYTTILADTTYYWRVRAMDWAHHIGDWSSIWQFTVDTQAPDVPTLYNPVGGIILGDSVVNFSWSEVTFLNAIPREAHKSYITGFDFYAAPICYVLELDTLNTFAAPVIVDTSETAHTTLNLGEHAYYWRVKAVDYAGNEGPLSDHDSFRVDISVPVIESTTVWNDTSFTGPFLVYTKITDNTELDTMLLYFKRVEDLTFYPTQLFNMGNNWYAGIIPQTFVTPDTVKYYVYARDIANPHNVSTDPVGAPANFYSFRVNSDTIPPTQVTLISPANNAYTNNATVEFMWHTAYDNLSGVDYYRLQYAADSMFTIGLVDTTTVDTTFTDVLTDTFYYWRARAVDRMENEGLWSAVWKFEIDTLIPQVPSLIEPVGGIYLGDTNVTFMWTGVTFNCGGLDIWHKNESGKGDPRASPVRYVLDVDTIISFTSPVTVDTFDINTAMITLEEYTRYFWRVKAYDLAGNEGPYAQPDSFGVDITPPTQVNLISPADNEYTNNATIEFLWHTAYDNLSGVDYYRLQYASDSMFSIGLVDTTTVDTTFTTVLTDTFYYWRVRAVDRVEKEGLWSAVWKFEVDTLAPQAPTLIEPVGGMYCGDTSVTFVWSEVLCTVRTMSHNRASPVQYILDVDTVLTFTSPVVIDTGETTTTVIPLAEYERYYWRVKAFDLAGNDGVYAEPDSFGIDITSPVIESTTVWHDTTFNGPFPVSTKITDVAGLDAVFLYFKRMEDSDFDSTELQPLGDDWYSGEILQVAQENDTIKYYIYAEDILAHSTTDPDGAPADYYAFVANVYTSIAEHPGTPEAFSFGLKQNPARGNAVFNLTLPSDAIVTLRMYDVSGRLVDVPLQGRIAAGCYEIHWSTQLSSGIYFYKVDSPWNHAVGKLVLLK